MNKLGLFVTCFDEVDAIRYALNSANRIYPDIPIFVNCESRVDLQCLAHDGLNVEVNYYEDTLSNVLPITEANYTSGENQRNIVRATKEILKRIVAAIPFLNSEFILLHCPDTIIRGKLNIPDDAIFLGSKVNKNFPKSISDILVQHGGVPVYDFGAVPAIFRTDRFLEAIEIYNSIPLFTEKLTENFYAIFSHDIISPILFSLIGEAERFNPDIVECGRNPFWKSTPCPLVHQFREKYPKRTSKYKANEQ